MTHRAEQSSSLSSPARGAAMDRKVEKPKVPLWRDKRLLITMAVGAIAVAGWRAIPPSGSTDVDGDNLQTGEVIRAAFADYLPVRASVVPATTTLVGVMSGGQVEELYVQDGTLVTKGQALATLANPDLELTVLSQEAQIASQLGGVAAENLGIQRSRVERASQVAAAEYDLVRARRDLDIRKQLHEKGFVSDAGVKSYQEEVDYQARRLSQLRHGSAVEAGITATQGQMLDATKTRLRSNLAAVRGSLDALTIRAPTAGRLTNFPLQPGQTLAPGDPAGQVDSEGAWKLEAQVDEFYLGRVEVGQKARTSSGAGLTVSKVLPTVGEGRFRIELTFNTSPKRYLNRGQNLDVRITLGAATSAVIAPVGGWLTDGGSSVFVIGPDGDVAHRASVEIGRRNPRQVEILSGLEPGQRIVISNLARVQGDTINIR
ncbi:hypothetical protein TMRH483_02751 [Qipengyuania sp. 483]